MQLGGSVNLYLFMENGRRQINTSIGMLSCTHHDECDRCQGNTRLTKCLDWPIRYAQ